MQDEVNTKVVAIAVKGGKITAEVLEKALKKFVEEMRKRRNLTLSRKPIAVSSPLRTLSPRTLRSATSK